MDTLWRKFKNRSQQQDQDARQKGMQQLISYKKTLQHGFPNRPSALAYDPKLNIIAIGTRSGSVKIYGAPGVECYAQHDADIVIAYIVFLPGQGRFITVCEDNSVNLWEITGRDKTISVELVSTVKLEGRTSKISTVCLSSFHEQLFVGTENGNTHVLNVDSFAFDEASVIYAEAASSSSTGASRSPPGPVEAITESPTNSNQLLIGFNKGLIVLWDLKEKLPAQSYWAGQQVDSLCWMSDGHRFFSSHNDGSYVTWDPSSSKPVENPNVPYGPYPCKPIPKLLWKTSKGSQPFVIFSGGMVRSRYGDHMTVTVMQGEKHVAFDFTSRVVDFFTIDRSDSAQHDEPQALIVLLEEELIAIDLTSEKWPIFQLPYLFVIHSSSITCSFHVSNIADDVWESIVTAGRRQDHSHFSSKPWPITGGQSYGESSKNSEMLFTGHEDGSVRFWDVSGPYLTLVYTLKTADLFRADDMDIDEEARPAEVLEGDEADEWPPFRKTGSFDPYSDDPRLAVQKLEFCTKTSTLLVAGTAGQIVIFDFKKNATLGKTLDHVTVNLVGDRDGFVWKGHSPLKLKSAVVKADAGFQPQMVVQMMPPAACTALALQTDWQLFGAGTAHGFMLMDYTRRKIVMARCTLQASEAVNGMDTSMTRRKSFKKSLRESFRRIRRGRSHMETKRAGPAGDRASPNRDLTDSSLHTMDTRPVEREIEARTVDNEMGSVVRCLLLVPCYILNGVVNSPTYWVGTNSGSVLIFSLVLPLPENRREEEIHASLSKEIQLRHHAPVVHIAVIDSQGSPVNEKVPTKDSSTDGSQKVVICSEEQFKIFNLPSLKPFTKFKLTATEGAQIRRVRIVKFISKFDEDVSEHCLTCLTNQGDISVFSLPNLMRLVKQDCIRREDINGISTLTFTKFGQGFYQKSPSELQRFTLSARNVVEPLCVMDFPENFRSSNTPRAPHSPSSRMSDSSRNQSPRLTPHMHSPESVQNGNNHIYSRTPAAAGVRSPDMMNLNESIRSDNSIEDAARAFSDINQTKSSEKSNHVMKS